jgi:beta-glucuronidase
VDERWAEEYHANLYQHQLNMLKKIPSLAGLSPWVLTDFHSLPGIRDYYNRTGLVSNLTEHDHPRYILQKFHREIEPER